MSPILAQILVISALASGFMLLLWFVQHRIHDAGVVDFGWALSLGLSALVYALMADGDPLRRAIIATLAGIWGVRLALHLLTDRVLRGPEDGRYEVLRKHYGRSVEHFFFLFFQGQAFSVVVLSLPFLLAANAQVPVGWLTLAGVGLWILAITGEAIADNQLRAFKADPSSRGKTCRRGLWRYSRHPNYFFEWLIWCAYALIALPAEYGWLGLLSPVIIFALVNYVTGIPPTEARAVRSRGDDYRRYQQETSPFFPWFPRKPARPVTQSDEEPNASDAEGAPPENAS